MIENPATTLIGSGRYWIVHVIATWGIGLVSLMTGTLSIRLAATPTWAALLPGLIVVGLGEFVRRRYRGV